ncbi:MAG: sugar transporter substrate-binding protein [Clostridia bacterium]|jgi:ABC-type sugar transport system substrate-binding protein|nr:sugar transporter substrate-binding protein [Clostridia bacterium]
MKLKRMVAMLGVVCMMMSGAGCAKSPAPKAEETQAEQAKPAEPEVTEPAATEAKDTTEEASKELTPPAGVKLNVQPADKAPDKPLRIAVICVQNNPFWFPVKDGVMYAKEVLAEKNTQVDFITVDDFDAKKFSDAIETCTIQQYDAITTVGASDAIVPAIDKAVDAGIIVNTFNCDTGKKSKRTAFFGQDLYNAGVKAGETIGELTEGKGKVAIITGLFSVPAHELRRKGGLEGLAKYPDIEVVGEVENKDKAETAYAQAKDFLTAHPDLKAIYVTAGGPFGAAKAIEEMGLTDQVKVVCFDFVDETIDYVRKGAIAATIGQDPFGQGFDPVVYAYNQLVTGEKPGEENMWTRLDVVTPDNVDVLIGPAK